MTRSKSKSGRSRTKRKSSRKASDFAYLNQRKCLRMMRRYYKDRFENCGIFENYKQEIRTCTNEEFDQAVRKFISIEFPYMLDYAEYCKYTSLEETLKTLILSDRYNKNETISEGLDFDLVRRVLYNFNTRNLINFFSCKCFAFLFYHYFDEFGQKDIHNQTDVDPTLLYKEMKELYREAEKYLKLTMDNYKRDCYKDEQPMSEFDYDEYMMGLF